MNPERTIGESLRQAREARGMSQEDVSRVTRISLAVIRKLELDRFSEMPGKLYTENFIRILADQLELDGQSLLTRYREGQQAEAIVEAPIVAPKASGKTKAKAKGEGGKRRKKEEHVTHVWHEETIQETRVRGWRLPWRLWLGLGSLALIAVLVLLVSTGYLNLRWGRQGEDRRGDPPAVAEQESMPRGGLLRAEASAPPGFAADDVAQGESFPAPPRAAEDRRTGEALPVGEEEPPVDARPQGFAPLRADAGSDRSDGEYVLPGPARLRLEIIATGASRVQLNVDDRRHLTRRFLSAGGSWIVEGEDFFIFSAADAEHLSLRLNGADYALPSAEAGRILALRLDGSTSTPEP